MRLTVIIKALVTSGATPEMILAAVEAYETEAIQAEAERLAKGAMRQKRYREKHQVTSCDVMSHNEALQVSPNGFPPPNGFPDPSLTPTQSLTPSKENTPKGVQKKVSPIEIPDWMPLPEWEGFKEMRNKIKKPMTLRAEKLAIGKLDKFRAKGHDPTEILNQSILNDYQDLYEPKEKHNGNSANYHKTPVANSKTSESLNALFAAGSRVIGRKRMESGESTGEADGQGGRTAAGTIPTG
jgi:hypothetical protein